MQTNELAENTIMVINMTDLFFRFLINLSSIFVLVRLIYYPLHRQRDYMFTFIVFNSILFIVCILLGESMMKMGFAFGLFAIFSIIRYRTVSIPIKEMGYFFVAVALAMINALASIQYYYLLLISSNVLILGVILILDRFVVLRHENKKEILYDKIDLIIPEKRDLLIANLKERTGINIHRVEVANINFLRDVALLTVFYYDKEIHSVDSKMKIVE